MKQLIQNTRSGKLALHEVPPPKVRAGHIMVKTNASLISAGTERLVVEFAGKSLAGKAKARPDLVKKVLAKAKRDGIRATTRAVLARLDEPLPLGYSAAGEVVAVGAGLEGRFRVGQRVAIAGAGLANHAEINVVPANLAANIPVDVPYENACYATVGAIAMHAVRNLGAGLGDIVAVIGVGLVGQLAAQLLSLSGARVIAMDYDRERLKLARRLGAEEAVKLGDDNLEQVISAFTGGRGCDGILIAAATKSNEPFQTAGTIARDRARVCLVGLTGTCFPYREFMKKELNIVVSRSYGPGRYDHNYEGRDMAYPEGWIRWTESENIGECLRLMAPRNGDDSRVLDVAAMTTHRWNLADAEAAYEMIASGSEPHLGVVLSYPEGSDERKTLSFPSPSATGQKDGSTLGVIGAGNFARAVLLPEIKKLKGVSLHTIVTRRGATAEAAAKAFGFGMASTDETDIFDNPEIDAVLIATRHDSHAELTARALAAGKSVLVEKPLGLDRNDINKVIEARNSSTAFFQIGFNRRFAPLAIKAREHLAATAGPGFVLMRINAGASTPDSWINDSVEGGGRILGEVCHFIDLARFLVGSPINSVQATATTAEDMSLTLRFDGGSLATIAYTALGDSMYSKELIEAYAGGSVISLDDFRSLKIVADGKVLNSSRKTQDKGFRDQLRNFFAAVKGKAPPPVDETELVETSIATIAVMESLQSGNRIDL